MKKPLRKTFGPALGVIFMTLLISAETFADPSRYPQFAQHQLAEGVTPEFIKLDELVDQIVEKQKPLIIDVRSPQEYNTSHIKGSLSIPLNEISLQLSIIPKDKLVVFY